MTLSTEVKNKYAARRAGIKPSRENRETVREITAAIFRRARRNKKMMALSEREAETSSGVIVSVRHPGGTTLAPIKSVDAGTRALIDAALARRSRGVADAAPESIHPHEV